MLWSMRPNTILYGIIAVVFRSCFASTTSRSSQMCAITFVLLILSMKDWHTVRSTVLNCVTVRLGPKMATDVDAVVSGDVK